MLSRSVKLFRIGVGNLRHTISRTSFDKVVLTSSKVSLAVNLCSTSGLDSAYLLYGSQSPEIWQVAEDLLVDLLFVWSRRLGTVGTSAGG